MDARRLGQAGLTGWRRRLSERIAAPVARRTPFTADTVLALFGLFSIVLSLRRLIHMARSLARELRS